MSERNEWRLFYRYAGTTGWDRWSGGFKQDRQEWERVATADAARRERAGHRKCEYAVRRRTVIDHPMEQL